MREHEITCASSGHLTWQSAQVLTVQFGICRRHRTLIEAVRERIRGLNLLAEFLVELEDEVVDVTEQLVVVVESAGVALVNAHSVPI